MLFRSTQPQSKHINSRKSRYKVFCETVGSSTKDNIINTLQNNGFTNIEFDEIEEPVPIKFDLNGKCDTPDYTLVVDDFGGVSLHFQNEISNIGVSKKSIQNILEKLDSKEVMELLSSEVTFR